MNARIYTIGHSNQTLESFLLLLSGHAVGVVVDVRSTPTSKYSPQFNGATLAVSLTRSGFKYVSMGLELGGRPSTSSYYDVKHRVLYDQVAQSSAFKQGIQRLQKGSESDTIAVMCSEEDPTHCHRRLLVGRVLGEAGVQVAHIRADGSLQTEAELARLEQATEREPQLALFESPGEYRAWRSAKPIPSASRKDAPRTSSRR
ncbi:MAG: DUF488 family protein [Chloroflexi bacterium]|nr:DUF488 family protein [Chloroflexota bacterium]